MTKRLTEEWRLSSDQVLNIIDDLAYLRCLVDLELIPRHSMFKGKPYPLGRCKEIRDAVFNLLQQELSTAPTRLGIALLQERLLKGATLAKVWGSLRDEYFQNAMVLDGWYIDVSNDTVNANKPRVEVIPLAESGFSSISSFEQFIKIAKRYWNVDVYRNTVCPKLAPFMPLVYVNQEGESWMGEGNDDMLALAMKTKFKAVDQVWGQLNELPVAFYQKWMTALESSRHIDLLSGSGDVLDYCCQYREQGYHDNQAFRDQVVMSYVKLPKAVLCRPSLIR